MNDDKLKSLFAIYEAREPGRAYVEPFHDSNGKQRGWKASTKWGRVKYFGSDFKSAAERHAGIDTSDNVNDQGMDEEVANAEKITSDPNNPTSRFWGSNSLTNIYKKDTPGQSAPLEEDSVPVIRRSYMRTNPRTGERKVIKGRSYKRIRDFTDDDDNKQDMPKGPVSV